MANWTETRGPILFALVVVGFTVYIASIAVYRLWFHPLAKYPAPFLNRVTQLPAILSVLVGRLPMYTKTLHDRYGPVVRLSPNELSFNSVQAWEDIYGHRLGRPNMAKDPIHVGAVDRKCTHGMLEPLMM